MILALACSAATVVATTNATEYAAGPPASTPLPGAVAKAPEEAQEQSWNWHAQNTDIVQYHPGFPASYSGPNSLSSANEVKETVTLDLYAGARLWHGAEAHVDGLMWQGFGLSRTFGIEGFPNGDGYKAGTETPNFTFARLFIRQTIGLGGEQEVVPDDPLTLAGRQDISRLTFTIGRLSPLDICDNNTYAHDPHTQFMNWAMMGNLTWDYGQDTVGYTTGFAVELNQPKWALRYGFFQMPQDKNGFTGDDQFLKWPSGGAYGPFLRAWAMMAEFERRYSINAHPGAIRFLAWLDEANFASYQAAIPILQANGVGVRTSPRRAPTATNTALGSTGNRKLRRGGRLYARRDPQRHHAQDAGEFRADARLHRGQDAALGLREVPHGRHRGSRRT